MNDAVMNSLKRIAVIPARGGSKRIPRKNIKPFCGKPMITWSIEAARMSGCFDRVIVSTDDVEIAEVSRDAGAEVPFLRPAALADDFADTISVVAHAIEWLNEQGEHPEDVCCLYATAPFVQPEDLRRGLVALQEHDAEYAFSVTGFAFPIQRAIRVRNDGRVEMFQPEHFATRSQDLEEAYHDAGQFYWGKAKAWCARSVIFGGQSVPVVLPRRRVQDIDTPEDWDQAEAMFQILQGRR